MKYIYIGLFSLLAASVASANQQTRVSIIHAGTVLAVPGEAPKTRASVIVADGKIVSVEEGFVQRPGAEIIDLSESFVLPGLIDAHIHMQFGGENYSADLATVEDGMLVLRGYAEVRRALEAGFTTLRDMAGDPDIVFPLRDAMSKGIVTGPRIVAAGPAIVPTGGGIIRGYRRDVMDMLADTNLEAPCDGAESCMQVTRQVIKDGADVVKIVVTGSILSPNAALTKQMSNEEISAIVEAAHGMGKQVSAHAHGLPGINAALAAGALSIEHGTFADDSSIKLLRKTGAYLVPTMTSIRMLRNRVERDPNANPTVRQNVNAADERIAETVRAANRAGVKIAFGTDINIGLFGTNAGEFRLLKAAGMREADMIRSATVVAAELLGVEDVTGTLSPGKSADVIAVDADPLRDITALEQVRFVMREGVIVKH